MNTFYLEIEFYGKILPHEAGVVRMVNCSMIAF